MLHDSLIDSFCKLNLFHNINVFNIVKDMETRVLHITFDNVLNETITQLVQYMLEPIHVTNIAITYLVVVKIVVFYTQR